MRARPELSSLIARLEGAVTALRQALDEGPDSPRSAASWDIVGDPASSSTPVTLASAEA